MLLTCLLLWIAVAICGTPSAAQVGEDVARDIAQRHARVVRRKQNLLLAHMPRVSRSNLNMLKRNAHAVPHKAGQLNLTVRPPKVAQPPTSVDPTDGDGPVSPSSQPRDVLTTHGMHTMHSGRNPRHQLHIITHDKIQAKRAAAQVGETHHLSPHCSPVDVSTDPLSTLDLPALDRSALLSFLICSMSKNV